MCRMIAVLGTTEFAIHPFISALSDAAQNALHAPHQDGHGIVYIAHDSPVTHKEASPIWQTSFAHKHLTTTTLMVHARKSSFGSIAVENIHPFIENTPAGSLSFMHNGTIYDASTLFPNVPFTQQMCDSRIYAGALASSITDITSFESALVHIAQTIRTRSARYTSANAVIFYQNTLYCVRSCTIEEDYYTLFYAMNDTMLLISTDRFGTYDWTLIPNHSIVKCSCNDKEKTVLELARI